MIYLDGRKCCFFFRMGGYTTLKSTFVFNRVDKRGGTKLQREGKNVSECTNFYIFAFHFVIFVPPPPKFLVSTIKGGVTGTWQIEIPKSEIFF